jgi:DMSO/TMAO reductase YedYZ molybdopterin-dependent catalytic subunit
MNRRDLLKTLPAVAAMPVAIEAAESPGLTVRMSEPGNLESDFSAVKSFLTPSEQFFVRSHFVVPAIDLKTWALEVTGDGVKSAKFTMDDLAKLGAVTTPITLECAGNGRVFLTPATRGLQWQQGAVGTAEWTGVPLKNVLEITGVNATAKEVILIGADKGAIADPATPGAIAFDRSIPLEKALKPECILATHMNGQPLTPSHGFPLRAVIGGYYGMASVKWLSRIVVTDKPYDGFWQTFDYSHWQRRDGGLASLVPVGPMQPKAQIARPTFGEVVPPNTAYTIRGAAWAGEASVSKVEVSVDGGATWQAATFTTDAKPFCWRLWELDWRSPAKTGPLKLLCRCVDDAGRGQPEKRDSDRRTYMINHPVPVEITIGEARK